jgi:hypothetical protein
LKVEDEYTVTEPAPGVKAYENQRAKRTTFLTATPWVHLHYMFDDDEVDRQGFAVTELMCHRCSTAVQVLWSLPPADTDAGDGSPRLKRIRSDFQEAHRGCSGGMPAGAYEMLCPVGAATKTSTLDLRAVDLEL